MKKLVTFIKQEIEKSYNRVLWYFHGERWMREYDERQQKERDEEEKALQEYYAELDKEKARWQKEADESRREQCEDEAERRRVQEDVYSGLQSFWHSLEGEEQDSDVCHWCEQVVCTCNDTVENFSEHPSLAAEDDAEPLSPEMEYWFTPCDKCGKYPEFCPCDGKFED